MDGLEVRQLVVVGVDASAEEEARVAAVDDLVGAELDEVGLVLLVAGGYEAVDLRGCQSCFGGKGVAGGRAGRSGKGWGGEEGTHLALELDLLLVAVRRIPLRQPGLTPNHESATAPKTKIRDGCLGSTKDSLPVLYQYEVQHRRVCWPPMRRGWRELQVGVGVSRTGGLAGRGGGGRRRWVRGWRVPHISCGFTGLSQA